MKNPELYPVILGLALILSPVVGLCGDKPVTTVKDNKTVSTNEAEVRATYEAIQEATCFFAFMAKSGDLSQTPTNIVKEFFVSPYPATFSARYPLKMFAEVTLKDQVAGRQQYFMEKPVTNSAWVMTEAWTVSTNGQRTTQLVLPAKEVQQKANQMLPLLLAGCASETSSRIVLRNSLGGSPFKVIAPVQSNGSFSNRIEKAASIHILAGRVDPDTNGFCKVKFDYNYRYDMLPSGACKVKAFEVDVLVPPNSLMIIENPNASKTDGDITWKLETK